MEGIDWLRIAKWVLIVLIAGFIGQFGKSFAKHLMEWITQRRAHKFGRGGLETRPMEPPPSGTTTTIPAPPEGGDAERAKEEAKREKKAAKALTKQKKKEAKQQQKEEKE